MRLEGLSWAITVKAPPFVESDKTMPFNHCRQECFSTAEKVLGQRRIINQHTLIVTDFFDDHIGNRARFVEKVLAASD